MERALLVFDPMNHQMLVVEAALRKGLTIVAITTMPLVGQLPYGRSIDKIKECVEVSGWLDEEALDKAFSYLRSKYDIVATYTAMEIVLPFEAKVRSQLGLPGFERKLVQKLLDKNYVRQQLRDAGLTKLKSYNESEVSSWKEWPGGFVGYFKPIKGSGSTHVVKCSTHEDYKKALASWERKDETSFAMLKQLIEEGGSYFIEEAAVGELLSVEALVFDGEVQVLGLTSRTVLKSNPIVELGALFPYQHKHLDKIVDKVKKIHEALGVKHAPTHTEIIVSPDGEVELVELNLRFAGADVLETINQAFNLRVEEQLLDLAMGRKPVANFDTLPYRFATIQYLMAPKAEGEFESIDFPEKGVVFTRIFQKIGDRFVVKSNQHGILAGFIAANQEYDKLIEEATRLRRSVKVNGVELGDTPNNLVDMIGTHSSMKA